jgi:DNA-binding transcriptional regulator YiaG
MATAVAQPGLLIAMNPEHLSRLDAPFENHHLVCPSCGRDAIRTVEIAHKFPYGDGDQAVELSVTVPLRHCLSCGFEFLDSVAEELQHDAVCRHLGVMPPAEVRTVRQKAGDMSRGAFARLTRLGEATIGRWERGELIQNAANDQLLYLLTFPENVNRLRERLEQNHIHSRINSSGDGKVQLRVLSRTRVLQEEAANFRLNTCGVV